MKFKITLQKEKFEFDRYIAKMMLCIGSFEDKKVRPLRD